MSLPINQILCADCLDILKDFPEKCVDLVLTDLPYGVGVEYDNFDDTQENLIQLINSVMPDILRISKRTVLTCGHTNIWHYPKANWVMAWVNTAGNNRNSWGFTCWQPILCYGKDVYLANGLGARSDVIVYNEPTEKLGHPCAKPLKFWGTVLQRTSIKESDLILDPFCGSCTTCVAAKMLGRNYIGIDISQNYVDIANERLAAIDTGVPVKEARAGQGALFQ